MIDNRGAISQVSTLCSMRLFSLTIFACFLMAKSLMASGFMITTFLAGSFERVNGILDLFAAESDLGLLFPDYLPAMLPYIGWGTMRSQVDQLLELFGFNTEPIELLEFPAGGFSGHVLRL